MTQRMGYLTAVALVVASVLVLGLVIFVEWPRRLPPIAFSAQTGYRAKDVWVTSGGSVQELTDDQLFYAPSWSPDGLRVLPR